MDLMDKRQLQKLEDWPGKLIAYLVEVENKPFKYGAHDCFLFAVDCVKVMTGVDMGVGWRGRYATELGAAKRVKERNKAWELVDFWDWLIGQHGGRKVNINFAQRGDPVFVTDNNNPALGIIDPGSIGILSVGETGLIRLKKESILQAWSIE